jgi:hypothetical protein
VYHSINNNQNEALSTGTKKIKNKGQSESMTLESSGIFWNFFFSLLEKIYIIALIAFARLHLGQARVQNSETSYFLQGAK